MESRLQQNLTGSWENYIFPFFWQCGGSQEDIVLELEKIHACGIRAVCVEARPHPDYCGPRWWSDMDIIMDFAEKHDMKVWLLDDDRFPTGHANKAFSAGDHPLSVRFLTVHNTDVQGPVKPGYMLVKSLLGGYGAQKEDPWSRDDKLVGVVAVRRRAARDASLDLESAVDVTEFVRDGWLCWEVPEGLWRILVFYTTRKGNGKLDYFNIVDSASVKVLLDRVYEPHFARYGEAFGKTFLGFFSDEPEFSNLPGYRFRARLGEDMPFLPNGRPLDIVLNPLGVPSRMNIGQVLEIHLSLAARALGFNVATPIFDGANEKDITDTLNLANDYVNLEWEEFEEKHKDVLRPEVLQYLSDNREHRELWKGVKISGDGKVRLRDGRTGEYFDSPVTIGHMHYLKLHHLVDDKIHARSTGPYALVPQQPLGGKAQFGGQRFGEMEVWALEAYGASYTLQEILTVKSDDVVGRVKTYEAIIKGDNIPEPGIPESFKVLLKELQALGLDVRVLREDQTEVEIMETIDYGDTDYRYEMGDDRKYDDYDNGSLGEMGYQAQEYDDESGEFIDSEDEDDDDDDFSDVGFGSETDEFDNADEF